MLFVGVVVCTIALLSISFQDIIVVRCHLTMIICNNKGLRKISGYLLIDLNRQMDRQQEGIPYFYSDYKDPVNDIILIG